MLDSGKTFLNLQDITDSIAKFGNYAKVAKEFETTPADVAQAAHEARQAGLKPSHEASIEKYDRQTATKVKKIDKTGGFSREDILEAIVRIYEDNDNKITARMFEDYSNMEFEWLQIHFGNWPEACRQAGIKPSSEEARTQRALAKIAAAERINPHLEKMRAAGTAYDRPTNAKEVRGLVISDTHDLFMDPLVRRAFVAEAATGEYHFISLNGDIYDFYEVSKYTKAPQWMNFQAARDFNRQFFYELREAAPDAQIDLIEGNHEYRFIKKCMEIPEMGEAMGLTGFDLPRLFRFDDLEMNYVGEKDFRMAEKPKWVVDPAAPQGKFYYDAFFVTHLPNFHKNAGVPGTHGHVHKFNAMQKYSLTHGNHHWWVTGAGCLRKAEYARGGTMLWNSGFLSVVINRRTKPGIVKAQWHQADDDIRVNGRIYVRNDDEKVGSDDVVEYNRRIILP